MTEKHTPRTPSDAPDGAATDEPSSRPDTSVVDDVQAGVPPRQDQVRPTTGLSPSQSGRPRDEGDEPIVRSGPQNPPPDSTAETPSDADLTDRETM